ncbi:hypothetical protein GALMADRAFT_1152025 [Galerina marginata CBS 339.88]|uniref:DUF6533 domain-containing protein n=1 Tax=Galerina marginata (strain CBS 339.88) TaxID=685588 RepID=A0A067SFG7_GALM3|nr:hypothetical protein GALMADRAFT_1152025 [Galerina marginata CBS 339.88]
MPPHDPLVGITDTRIVSYVWVSGLVVLTYDTILTLPREVTYIWREKLSLPSVLYLTLRYWGLFQVYIRPFKLPLKCQLFFGFVASIGSNTVLILVVNGILGTRLYALYNRSHKVLFFLFILFAGEFTVLAFTAVKIGISTVSTASLPPPGIPILGCLTSPPNTSMIKLAWIASIIAAVVCFIMTMVRFIQSGEEIQELGLRRRFPPLAKAFIRDGAVYFLVVVATLSAGAATTSFILSPLIVLYEPWVAASLIITGSRLVLNLREAAVTDFSNNVFESLVRDLELETLPATAWRRESL